MKKTEVVEAIENGRLFDFVSNEYYRMSKTELIGLCKELAYYFDYAADRYNSDIRTELSDTIVEENLTYNFED